MSSPVLPTVDSYGGRRRALETTKQFSRCGCLLLSRKS